MKFNALPYVIFILKWCFGFQTQKYSNELKNLLEIISTFTNAKDKKSSRIKDESEERKDGGDRIGSII